MIYKVTFFKRDISSQEWMAFINSVLEASRSVKFTIIFQSAKCDFFLTTDKKLDLLNGRIFPYYLTDEISNVEMDNINKQFGSNNLLPVIINKNVVEFARDEEIRGRHLVKMYFKISKYNPFKTLPGISIIYEKDGKLIRRKGVCPNHLYNFLNFDLNNSISSEITKVQPTLLGNTSGLDLSESGILEIKESAKRLSVSSYDFWRHTLIIGQSGSGKSILSKLIIEDIAKKFSNEYAVLLVDPHGALDNILNIANKKPPIDFKNTKTDIFVNIGQPTLSTELTIGLFSSILSLQENQDLARVLKFSLHTLFSIGKMTLPNLKNLLTDSIFRKEILKEVKDDNDSKFFETEFQSIYNSKYATAVLPILNLISEMDFIQNAPTTVDLAEHINNNFLTSISLRQSELGTRATKIIGGAIIQQIFTLMMAGKINKKVILAVDELSIVQTPSLAFILSESRKFNLSILIIQQYLMQISAELIKSVFANVVNYFCFKLAREDAEILAKTLNMEINEYFLKNKNDPREVQEIGTKILTDLNPQYVISRILAKNQYVIPFKSKAVNVNI